MSTADAFSAAQVRVKALTKRPSNDELLKLYAYFKQATSGDASGPRPGVFDLKGRAKFDAWKNLSGLSKTQAESQYIQLVEELERCYR